MRAMVLEKTGPVSESSLQDSNLSEPVPGPGEILVQVNACGVCRTDLHTVEGDLALPRLPVIPGHQVVGTVRSLGKGVERFREGDRVGVAWLNGTCGRCRLCLSGMENLCESARFTGFHRDGGYAEVLVVSADFAYSMPAEFPDIQAAPLLCAGIIGYRALKLSGIKPGGRLGLFGFGASAHVAVQIARFWGCDIYAFSRGEGHRRLAENLGAAWTGRTEEKPPVKLDAAVVFAPAGEVVLKALEALDRGGTAALAGIHMSPIPAMDYERHLFYEKTLRSVTAATRVDGQELMDLAPKIPIHTQVETFPLSAANDALVDLKEGRINGAGVLVV